MTGPFLSVMPVFTDETEKAYVAPDDATAVAYLRSPSYPGIHIKLNAAGEKWVSDKMSAGSEFTRDWKLEKRASGRSSK